MEVAALGSPSLMVLMVSVNVKLRHSTSFILLLSFYFFQALEEGCRLQNTACSLVSNVTRPTESGVATLPHTHRSLPNSKHWFTSVLPSISPSVFIYAIGGSRKLSANQQFFVGAQTVAGLLQTTQISDWAIHL